MNTISVILILGWLMATLIGLGIFAMSYYIGNTYVFTSEGVNSVGPTIGKSVANIAFGDQVQKFRIRDLVSNKSPTLFIFLDSYTQESDELIDGFVQFAQLSNNACEFVIFCTGLSSSTKKRLKRAENYARIFATELQDSSMILELQKSLGVRVTPFAILIGMDARVLSKGLVNNLPHLCYLITQTQMADYRFVDQEQLRKLAIPCNQYLPVEMRIT